MEDRANDTIRSESASQLSILVVEDLEDARDALCELLKMLGHEVRGAESAEQALDLFTTQAFQVLMTDISLPTLSGIELARRALVHAPELRVILASGACAPESDELGFRCVTLLKPYTLQELESALRDVSQQA